MPETPAAHIKLTYRLTDLGNAERFVARFGTRARFVKTTGLRGRWQIFDDGQWRPDALGQVWKWAKLTVRGIPDEAEAVEDTHAQSAIRAWALRSESLRHIEALLRLARSRPRRDQP